MQRSALCRSRRELSNAYFLANLASIQPRTSPVKFVRSAPTTASSAPASRCPPRCSARSRSTRSRRPRPGRPRDRSTSLGCKPFFSTPLRSRWPASRSGAGYFWPRSEPFRSPQFRRLMQPAGTERGFRRKSHLCWPTYGFMIIHPRYLPYQR